MARARKRHAAGRERRAPWSDSAAAEALRAMPEAVVVCDREGRIVAANDALHSPARLRRRQARGPQAREARPRGPPRPAPHPPRRLRRRPRPGRPPWGTHLPGPTARWPAGPRRHRGGEPQLRRRSAVAGVGAGPRRPRRRRHPDHPAGRPLRGHGPGPRRRAPRRQRPGALRRGVRRHHRPRRHHPGLGGRDRRRRGVAHGGERAPGRVGRRPRRPPRRRSPGGAGRHPRLHGGRARPLPRACLRRRPVRTGGPDRFALRAPAAPGRGDDRGADAGEPTRVGLHRRGRHRAGVAGGRGVGRPRPAGPPRRRT